MDVSNLTVLQINQKFRKSEAQISADYFHFPAQSYSFSLTSLTDQGALKSCRKPEQHYCSLQRSLLTGSSFPGVVPSGYRRRIFVCCF